MHRLVLALVLTLVVAPLNAVEDLVGYKIPDGFHLKIGAPMPTVELQGLDNRSHSTGEFKGKPTVVSFFTSNCSPCIEEIPALNQFMAQRPEIQVVAISPDGAETSASIQKKHGLKWPVLVNAESTLNSWGVLAFPSFVLLDPKGIIVSATYGNRLSDGDGYATSAGISRWVKSVLPKT